MQPCPRCGTPSQPGMSFCVQCGAGLHATAYAAPRPTYAAPPAPTGGWQQPGPMATGPRGVDLVAMLRGNWVGSARVALVVLGVSGLLSLGLALLAKPADFGVDNTLTLVAVVMTGAFGADLVADGRIEDYSGSASGGWIPLTVTVLTLAAAVWAFRGMVRGYPRAWPAVADAARVALLVAGPLLVVALAFRSDGREYGGGWAGEATSDLGSGDRLDIGASASGAFFLGLLHVFVVLALVALVRRQAWTGRMAVITDWLRAPLLGLATMAALLPLAGLIGFGLLMFGGNDITDGDPSSDDVMAAVALILGYLADGGAALVAVGTLAAYGSTAQATDQPDYTETHRLWWFTDAAHGDEPGLWAAPAVTVLLLVVGALVVARAARSRETMLRDLLVWAGSMLLFAPLLVRVSSGHGTFEVSGEGEDFEASGYVGPVGWQVTLVLLVLALVIALLVARSRGVLDTSRLRAAAARLQSTPGQPVGQPWGPPPPATHPVPQHWDQQPTRPQQWYPPRD